jgi:DNA invertase Pin-like site-specific DNA recombinase
LPQPERIESVRTLLYARYSSQLQNARSIEDQMRLLRDRADREGWTIVDVFTDYAISGAAGFGPEQRPGLNALLERVEAGGVDQVFTESTDRIARHQGDAFTIRERLRFAGCRLFTLLDGEVDEITGTIKGLMDARMRTDLGARIRRGARGTVSEGRAAGGLAYGYRRANRLDDKGELIRGLREIDADEAEIVLRCFREFAAGRSAIKIGQGLNEDGVVAPRKNFWRASTLIGQPKLQTGILRNPIYIGQIAYGRTQYVQSPKTRRLVVRPGQEGITIGRADHLRIVSDELWQAVQERLAAASEDKPHRQRRPKHVLSGLGVCGVCGGNWIITGNNGAYGSKVWGCARAVDRACTNRRQITQHRYEARVLADLKGQMLAPDVVAAFVREYHLEHARQSRELSRGRDKIERLLAEAGRKRDRLVAAVAEGGSSFPEIKASLTAARDDHERLRRELASMDALPVLAFHPGLADTYRREIEELEQLLALPTAHLEAIPQIRRLIERIELMPAEGKLRGVDLRVIRRIDHVLEIATRRHAAT